MSKQLERTEQVDRVIKILLDVTDRPDYMRYGGAYAPHRLRLTFRSRDGEPYTWSEGTSRLTSRHRREDGSLSQLTYDHWSDALPEFVSEEVAAELAKLNGESTC